MRKFIILFMMITLIFLKNCGTKGRDDGLLSEEHYPSIKIIVQNGCGFSGVANNVKNYLNNKNIDVLGVSNTRKFIYDETIIVVKHDDEVDLKRLKRMTGIDNVIYSINESFFVPYIIIAGKDYKKYFGD